VIYLLAALHLDAPFRLRGALAGAENDLSIYDIVLIDCPPSLGRLLAGAMTVADRALIVTDAAASEHSEAAGESVVAE